MCVRVSGDAVCVCACVCLVTVYHHGVMLASGLGLDAFTSLGAACLKLTRVYIFHTLINLQGLFS